MSPDDANDEVSRLVGRLQRTKQRLHELTGAGAKGPLHAGGQSDTPEIVSERLRKIADHYGAIINSTGDAIIRNSLDGIITGWSRGAETIFGYARAEMLGHSINRLLPEDRLAEEANIFNQVAQGDEIKPFDTVWLRKDGKRIHISLAISPIADDLRNITGVSTIARDISERIRIEEALVARERELSRLAEAMPHIVWVARPDGWYTYFNQRWVDYTGMSLEESCGHGWSKPYHPDDRRFARDAWQNAVNRGGTYLVECRLRRADGAYRWWLARGVPSFDETGNVSTWYGTYTDIQQVKETELEMETTREAFAESEARFRGAFETAAHGMALLSIEWDFIKVNQSLCNMLGYPECPSGK
jgi:PAS domain S-box-containing protein